MNGKGDAERMFKYVQETGTNEGGDDLKKPDWSKTRILLCKYKYNIQFRNWQVRNVKLTNKWN